MLYRELKPEDLKPELFQDFNRRQVVRDCWRREGDHWVIRPDPFIDDWTAAERAELLTELRELLVLGGFVYGCFCCGSLKGFVSVAFGHFGPQQEYMDMTNLHVSAEFRRSGIGTKLFLAAADWASAQGAGKLYLSAHSAAESQAFYRTLGCTDAAYPQQHHQEKEPFDCQMEYDLSLNRPYSEAKI